MQVGWRSGSVFVFSFRQRLTSDCDFIWQEVEDYAGTPLRGPVNTSPKPGPRCSHASSMTQN